MLSLTKKRYLRTLKFHDMNHDKESSDELYMQRCIELAQMAEGRTYPNPMVGSVIVHNGRIIGEGYHRKAGTPHAEVNAVHSVPNSALLSESTLYVNLEPCAHYGRTPPCARLIIDSKIPRVVVGCVDTFSKVAGKGIAMMREAGIDVRVGVLEEQCRKLNRRFFTYHEKHRPYIILKWAESSDGYLDAPRDAANRPTWLTNEACRRLVHRQRTTEAAILIGVNTALLDNPSLTPRLWKGPQPLRIVIDPHLRMHNKLTLLADELPTLIFNSLRNETQFDNKYYKQIDFSNSSLDAILTTLYDNEIQSIIVEGGAYTLQRFISQGMWDEVWRYRGAVLLGGGVKAPALPEDAVMVRHYNIDESELDILEKKH